MKLNDKEKEELKKDIQNSDPKRQKREFMDMEQKEKNKKNNSSEKEKHN
ncbi:hypothetical protein NE848_02260 [Gramella jeungdoensis]|uniref:Cold-shock protein n=1 Tax=Gramella jeungdoensis TaxID=708091 RepID=A0ABT0YZ61_9FLAO|nr:hypothetical protein [Gramella jeungdoensis]MCM8568182.1 hypothetical protein [Gramella jeungdoensis]